MVPLTLTALISAAFAVGNNPGPSTSTSDGSNQPFIRPYDFDPLLGTNNDRNNHPTVIMTHKTALKRISGPVPTAETTRVHADIVDEPPGKTVRPSDPQPTLEVDKLPSAEAGQSYFQIPSTTTHVYQSYDPTDYIERRYEYLNPQLSLFPIHGTEYQNPQLSFLPIHGTDTPTVIGTYLLERLQKKDIIAIVGETGSGKTVALKRILSKLQSIHDDRFPTFIDANNLMPEGPPVYWQTVLKEKLFGNVFNYAAPRVNIFIDNIDKLPSYATQVIISCLEKIQRGGSGIVLTSSSDNLIINTLVKPEKTLRIPQLNIREIELFLTRQWDKKLNPLNHRSHVDYATAVAVVVGKAPVFKNFVTMTVFSKILATNENTNSVAVVGDLSQRVFDDKSGFQSVMQYAHSGVSDRIMLINMLKETKFNKFGLTETLVSPLIKHYHSHAVPAVEHVLRLEVFGSALYEALKLIREQNTYLMTHTTDILWHKDNADFLTAQYFLDYVRHGEQRIIPAIGELMANPAYTKIVEYFNAALRDNKLIGKFGPVFNHIVTENDERWHKIMDNAISLGFDEIAAGLFEAIDSTEKISAYFQNSVDKVHRTLLKSTSENRLGMLTEVQVPIQANRQEMLFRKSMKKTILKLSDSEEPRYGAEYKMWRPKEFIDYLNDFFLCQSRPDIDIYTTIRNYEKSMFGTLQLSVSLANSRLYKIIKYSDIRSRPIIDELVSAGAIPQYVGQETGETLVHLTVAKRDSILLNYIISSLKVQITDRMETLLITALDSNPLPFYSRPQFWAVMYTLVSNDRLRVPQIQYNIDVVPTPADYMSPAYKLITGADLDALDEARSLVMVSNEPIEQLSPGLRSIRRKSVLGNLHYHLFRIFEETDRRKPLVEVILKYRGLDTYLSPHEQSFYEKTLIEALKFTIGSNVPLRHEQYLTYCLQSTVATNQDYFFVRHIIENFIQTYGVDARSQLWKDTLLHLDLQWQQEPKIRLELIVYSLKSGMILERATWLRKSLENLKTSRMQEDSSKNKILREILNAGPLGCRRFQRRRRRATNCLISKEEYDQIVKIIEENGREIPIIDTEEFMKSVDEWQFADESKYKELTELGKTLVEKYDARLVGDYEHLVEDHIHTHKKSNYDYINSAADSQIGISGNAGIDSDAFNQHESAPFRTLSESTSHIHMLENTHPSLSPLLFGETHHTHVKSDIVQHPTNLPGGVFATPYQLGRAPAILPKVIHSLPEVFHGPEIIEPPVKILKLPTVPRTLGIPLPKIQFRFRGK